MKGGSVFAAVYMKHVWRAKGKMACNVNKWF